MSEEDSHSDWFGSSSSEEEEAEDDEDDDDEIWTLATMT